MNILANGKHSSLLQVL
jgi:hypothetical protein